jgi:hypothetical protein
VNRYSIASASMKRRANRTALLAIVPALLLWPSTSSAQINLPPHNFHWVGQRLRCLEAITDADRNLRAYISGLERQADAVRDDVAQRTAAFEMIKALTMVEATRESGMITVLPAFPAAAVPTSQPSSPGDSTCRNWFQDRQDDLARLRRTAAARREDLDRANEAMDSLRISYVRFKALFSDPRSTPSKS